MRGLLVALLVVVTLTLAALSAGIAAEPAAAQAQAAPGWTKNCTALNKRYAHGVGRVGAHDKTKSGDPVTNFKRSNTLYATAMRWNSDLDRDRDKIACEKH